MTLIGKLQLSSSNAKAIPLGPHNPGLLESLSRHRSRSSPILETSLEVTQGRTRKSVRINPVYSVRAANWLMRRGTPNMNTAREFYMGLSENRVYSQWNSHLIGIMISKTIGFRGTNHFQTHPYITSHFLISVQFQSSRNQESTNFIQFPMLRPRHVFFTVLLWAL